MGTDPRGLQIGISDVITSVSVCMRPHFDLDYVILKASKGFTTLYCMSRYAEILYQPLDSCKV